MTTTGPNLPAAAATDSAVGTLAWSGTANVLAIDGSTETFATTGTTAYQYSHYMKLTGFGFSIAADQQIDGILVEAFVGGQNSNLVEGYCRLCIGGAITGSDLASHQSAISMNPYGSANAAVTTTNTTLTDTRLNLAINSLAGAVVQCGTKSLTVTSNTATTLTGSGWSGGGNPGNGLAWNTYQGGAAILAYGGSSALWGTTPSYADINASNFGVFISLGSTDGSGKSNYTGKLNAVRITITHSTAAPSGQPTSKRFGGVPFMGAHGAGIPSAVRQWMRRDSGLFAPRQQVATAIWRPAHGIN